jgi:hypothetical protein
MQKKSNSLQFDFSKQVAGISLFGINGTLLGSNE